MSGQPEKKITRELNRLASYRGLMLSYRIVQLLLIAIFLFLALTEQPSLSPLYIVLVLALLPLPLESVFRSRNKKRGSTVSLPLLHQKYRYTAERHAAYRSSFLIGFLMLLAWRLNYILFPIGNDRIMLLPVLLGTLGLLLRIGVSLFYRIYFRLFPLHSMK